MKKGYTLIELIIVIAIIGILMLPTLKLTKSFVLKQAKVSKRRTKKSW